MDAFYLTRRETRRYGVIECDPLVQNGLEKSVSNSRECLYLNSCPHFIKRVIRQNYYGLVLSAIHLFSHA